MRHRYYTSLYPPENKHVFLRTSLANVGSYNVRNTYAVHILRIVIAIHFQRFEVVEIQSVILVGSYIAINAYDVFSLFLKSIEEYKIDVHVGDHLKAYDDCVRKSFDMEGLAQYGGGKDPPHHHGDGLQFIKITFGSLFFLFPI
jgi:hypothetical protein